MTTLLGKVAVPVAALAAAVLACGGEEPPAKSAETQTESNEAPRESGLKVKSELGSVDPAAVSNTFHTLSGAFEACQRRGTSRVEVLAGPVKFFVRIGEDGSAKWAYLLESELGDRDTERCLLDAVMGARWPKPDGGDAEARYGMELPLQATRPPNDWSSDRVSDALAKAGDSIGRCKGGLAGTFHATMYVGEGTGKSGRVLAVGVAPPSKEGEEKVDCIVKALKEMKVPTPGTWPAKVSFDL
jgi:hypothetical protein